jgi:hypothetical protein
MSATNFRATVNATGDKLHASDKSAMLAALGKFASQEVVVTVEEFNPATNPMRRYYFGVVVESVRRHLNKSREIPLSNKQTHKILKGAFLPEILGVDVATELGDAELSTKGMSVDKFLDYIESICAHSASEWGEAIERPGE